MLFFAFMRLHLSPEAVWSLTLPELAALRPASAPLRRDDLAALMQRWPDT